VRAPWTHGRVGYTALYRHRHLRSWEHDRHLAHTPARGAPRNSFYRKGPSKQSIATDVPHAQAVVIQDAVHQSNIGSCVCLEQHRPLSHLSSLHSYACTWKWGPTSPSAAHVTDLPAVPSLPPFGLTARATKYFKKGSSPPPRATDPGVLGAPCEAGGPSVMQPTPKQTNPHSSNRRPLGLIAAEAFSPAVFTCTSVQREPTPGGPGSGLRPGRRRFLCQLPLPARPGGLQPCSPRPPKQTNSHPGAHPGGVKAKARNFLFLPCGPRTVLLTPFALFLQIQNRRRAAKAPTKAPTMAPPYLLPHFRCPSLIPLPHP
jgi:hypothetical protein